jgi:hypothetical protein
VTVLRFVWTLPNTELGLVLGLLTFQAPRTDDRLVMFDRRPRGITWWMPRLGRSAMTVGQVILSSRPLSGRLLAHERHHVRQDLAWDRSSSRRISCWRSPSATDVIRWSGPPSRAADADGQ